MRRDTSSGENKTIQEVWDWYTVQSQLSLAKKSQVVDALRDNRPILEPALAGLSLDDIDEFFLELDYLTMLDLLAATEAAVRLDYLARGRRQAKGPKKRAAITLHFRTVYNNHGSQIRLREDILGAWKRHLPSCKTAAGKLAEVLKLRHWLAHGRYWRRHFAIYNPNDVFDLCYNFMHATGICA